MNNLEQDILETAAGISTDRRYTSENHRAEHVVRLFSDIREESREVRIELIKYVLVCFIMGQYGYINPRVKDIDIMYRANDRAISSELDSKWGKEFQKSIFEFSEKISFGRKCTVNATDPANVIFSFMQMHSDFTCNVAIFSHVFSSLKR